ncbi:MAG: hypothetical protein Q7T82_01635 [Armatimonadota bacterium]|nr:hypothetical protein [Armatimonadota bacterium]
MSEETPEQPKEKSEKTDELKPMAELTPEERRRIHREEKARIAEEERRKANEERLSRALYNEQRQAELDEQRRKRDAQREAAYWASVKLGKCPQCGSTRIKEFEVESGGDDSMKWAAGCLGCCLFAPLLLLIPFVGRKPVTETHRQCHDCGYRWRV